MPKLTNMPPLPNVMSRWSAAVPKANATASATLRCRTGLLVLFVLGNIMVRAAVVTITMNGHADVIGTVAVSVIDDGDGIRTSSGGNA